MDEICRLSRTCVHFTIVFCVVISPIHSGVWVTTKDQGALHGNREHGTGRHGNYNRNHGGHGNQGEHGNYEERGTSSEGNKRRQSIFHSYQSQILEKGNGNHASDDERDQKEKSAIKGQSIIKEQTVLKGQMTQKGQSAPNCMYSFIVNELDSSKCPMLLQQMQNMQNDNSKPGRAWSAELSDSDLETIDHLSSKMGTIETKLYQEIAQNRNIEKNMIEQEHVVKKTEQDIRYHQHNISRLMSALRRLEINLGKQRIYWKNVDNKLAGVMLDVVEVNNRLDRNQHFQKTSPAKSIAVEAPSRISCTGVTGRNITRYKDCEELYHNGYTASGNYYITPIYTLCPIPVYCDMDTPPGGWLVLQRRMDGSVSFNRTWREYRDGFGDVSGEFWLGNDNIFLLSNQLHYELRVDLWDFYSSRVFAEYRHFKLDGERDRFRLHISNHTGTAPDGFTNHNNVPFSTPDVDNDAWPDYHCAREWGAGWWFNNCWFVILNGPYYNKTNVKYRGISWNDWKTEQLKKVEMKIRPSGF